MKIKIHMILALLSGVLILNSCEEDPLDLFADDLRDGITGDWKVDEDSELFDKKDLASIYNVTITKDPLDSTAVYVWNFYQLKDRVKIILDGPDLTIPVQVIDNFTIQNGYGEIADDFEKITLYYYVLFAGERDVVEAVYTRP